MKKKGSTQSNGNGTREMLDVKNVQNQKFQHEETYLRVKREIEDLQLELSNDNFNFFVIERSKVRTVLRVIYFLPQQQFVERPRHITKDNWFIQKRMKIEQNFISSLEQKQDSIILASPSISEQDNQIFAVFTCIIQYDIYPFSPPYIFMTGDKNLCLTAFVQNDFRNIIGELFQDIDWFPIYGLFDVFVKIPYFVSKLKNKDVMRKSTYYYPKPFIRDDIENYSLGLRLCDGEFYDSKDALIGKYLHKVIGISFQHLIVFNLLDRNKLTIFRTFKLTQIQQIKIEQDQKRIKFILKFSNQQQIRYKFIKTPKFDKKRQIIPQQQKGNIDEFINWMRICLLNCQLMSRKINNNRNIQELYKNKYHKKIMFRDNKIQNIQKLANQSTFYGNKNQDLTKKYSSVVEHQNLMQKQQLTALILQTIDLLLALPKYQKYQKQYQQDDDIEQIFYVQQVQNKERMIRKQKSTKKFSELYIDLKKLEYKKLKQYNNLIESERKRIFRLI